MIYYLYPYELKKYQDEYSIESYFKYVEIATNRNLSQDLILLHKLIDNQEPLFDVFFRNIDCSYDKTKENMIKDMNIINQRKENEKAYNRLLTNYNYEDMKNFIINKNQEYLRMTKEELELIFLIKELPKKVGEIILKKKFHNANQVIEYLEKIYDNNTLNDEKEFILQKPYNPEKFKEYDNIKKNSMYDQKEEYYQNKNFNRCYPCGKNNYFSLNYDYLEENLDQKQEISCIPQTLIPQKILLKNNDDENYSKKNDDFNLKNFSDEQLKTDNLESSVQK